MYNYKVVFLWIRLLNLSNMYIPTTLLKDKNNDEICDTTKAYINLYFGMVTCHFWTSQNTVKGQNNNEICDPA